MPRRIREGFLGNTVENCPFGDFQLFRIAESEEVNSKFFRIANFLL